MRKKLASWPSPIPNFSLTPTLVHEISREEAFETVEALKQCDLLYPPYEELTLTFTLGSYFKSDWVEDAVSDEVDVVDEHSILDNTKITVCLTTVDQQGCGFHNEILVEYPNGQWGVFHLGRRVWTSDGIDDEPSSVEETEDLKTTIGAMIGLMFAALATKDGNTTTAYNKRASRGIGRGLFRARDTGVIYTSRTVLDAPKVYNSTGRRVRVHWRRGHAHRWRKKDGTFVQKFLPPIWVNLKRDGGAVPAPPNYEVA